MRMWIPSWSLYDSSISDENYGSYAGGSVYSDTFKSQARSFLLDSLGNGKIVRYVFCFRHSVYKYSVGECFWSSPSRKSIMLYQSTLCCIVVDPTGSYQRQNLVWGYYLHINDRERCSTPRRSDAIFCFRLYMAAVTSSRQWRLFSLGYLSHTKTSFTTGIHSGNCDFPPCWSLLSECFLFYHDCIICLIWSPWMLQRAIH